MANTGYKQATIAYKTTPDGRPVDVDGRLTSVSGKRQAIALLIGRSNPNPTLYEVQFYFNAGGNAGGNSTVMYDVSYCPVGYISITPSSVILEPGNLSGVFTLESTGDWFLVSSPNGFNVDYQNGSAGVYDITVSVEASKLNASFGPFGAIRKTGNVDGSTTASGYSRTSVTANNMFIVQPGRQHFYTGQIENALYAGVIFQDVNHNFLGYACGNVQNYVNEPLTLPEGTYYIGACSFNSSPVITLNIEPSDGYITYENQITGEQATVYVAYVTSRPWVLTTGTWNMLGFWYDNEIWNYS